MPKSSLLVASALAMLSFLLSGCGEEAPQEVAVSAVDGPASGQPIIKGLTCETNKRSGGTLDYLDNTDGDKSLEKAIARFAKPDDEVVVTERSDAGATAYMLRPDGTAYTRLDWTVLTDSTWRLEGVESCSGEEPFPR